MVRNLLIQLPEIRTEVAQKAILSRKASSDVLQETSVFLSISGAVCGWDTYTRNPENW